jgi:hypothetical protein
MRHSYSYSSSPYLHTPDHPIDFDQYNNNNNDDDDCEYDCCCDDIHQRDESLTQWYDRDNVLLSPPAMPSNKRRRQKRWKCDGHRLHFIKDKLICIRFPSLHCCSGNNTNSKEENINSSSNDSPTSNETQENDKPQPDHDHQQIQHQSCPPTFEIESPLPISSSNMAPLYSSSVSASTSLTPTRCLSLLQRRRTSRSVIRLSEFSDMMMLINDSNSLHSVLLSTTTASQPSLRSNRSFVHTSHVDNSQQQTPASSSLLLVSSSSLPLPPSSFVRRACSDSYHDRKMRSNLSSVTSSSSSPPFESQQYKPLLYRQRGVSMEHWESFQRRQQQSSSSFLCHFGM